MKVFVSGVFDLFHYGHMDFISRVKDMYPNCILSAGVHTDEETIQNKRNPIMCMEERIRAVKMCRFVDEVVASCPYKLSVDMWPEFKKRHGIDMVVACESYNTVDDVFYPGPCKDNCLIYLPRTPCISTTDIIQRVKESK
jgi:choline-phosphate cytidylyltransferase